MGNTAATEIGDRREPRGLDPTEYFIPSPDTGDCICAICQPEVYARHAALDKLDKVMEAWSNVLVDSENSYTEAGDDPAFDLLHGHLNAMQDTLTDEINLEDERIDRLRGD